MPPLLVKEGENIGGGESYAKLSLERRGERPETVMSYAKLSKKRRGLGAAPPVKKQESGHFP